MNSRRWQMEGTAAAGGVQSGPKHGSSLHPELELRVQAALSAPEALRAATVLPARHFGLAERGTVTPGARADLVLSEGDPLVGIRATHALRQAWCAGFEHPIASEGDR